MIIDTILFALLLFGVYKGYKKGLIKALFFLIGVFVGFIAGIQLCMIAVGYVSGHGLSHSKWLPPIIFFVIFISCILLSSLLAKVFEKSGEVLMLGWINRILGIFLYCFFYVVTFSCFLYFGSTILSLSSGVTNSSFFYKHLINLTPLLMQGLGKVLPFINATSYYLKNFFETASGNLN